MKTLEENEDHSNPEAGSLRYGQSTSGRKGHSNAPFLCGAVEKRTRGERIMINPTKADIDRVAVYKPRH